MKSVMLFPVRLFEKIRANEVANMTLIVLVVALLAFGTGSWYSAVGGLNNAKPLMLSGIYLAVFILIGLWLLRGYVRHSKASPDEHLALLPPLLLLLFLGMLGFGVVAFDVLGSRELFNAWLQDNVPRYGDYNHIQWWLVGWTTALLVAMVLFIYGVMSPIRIGIRLSRPSWLHLPQRSGQTADNSQSEYQYQQ